MKLCKKVKFLLREQIEGRQELKASVEEEFEELSDNFSKNADKYDGGKMELTGAAGLAIELKKGSSAITPLSNILKNQGKAIANHYKIEFAPSYSAAQKFLDDNIDTMVFDEVQNNNDTVDLTLGLENSSNKGFTNIGDIKRLKDVKNKEKEDKNKEREDKSKDKDK